MTSVLKLKHFLFIVLVKLGFHVKRLNEEQRRYLIKSHKDDVSLPEGAVKYLVPDNPILRDLRRSYESSGCPGVARGMWQQTYVDRQLLLQQFRGDNAYVWQYRDARTSAQMQAVLVHRYLTNIDHMKWLELLVEDGLFGCHNFILEDGGSVSRDLMDSVNEMLFLESEIGISRIEDVHVLDIGAGYGRLAYRMLNALPNVQRYICVDGIPESTFICDYYLRFRQVTPRAVTVKPFELERSLQDCVPLLAVNTHSFSEMPLQAIDWWVAKVAAAGVRYFFLVPNDEEHMLSTEANGSRMSFAEVFSRNGYRLRTQRAKYLDPDVQRVASHKAYQYFIFELEQ